LPKLNHELDALENPQVMEVDMVNTGVATRAVRVLVDVVPEAGIAHLLEYDNDVDVISWINCPGGR
jgi:hypothetical protein